MSRADSDMADGRQGHEEGWAIARPFHALVDESEVRGFSLTAVAVATADAEDIRSLWRWRQSAEPAVVAVGPIGVRWADTCRNR